MAPVALARRSAFWTLDRMRGRPVATAVAGITALHHEPGSPAAVATRRSRLARILRHAIATTPFYARHGGGAHASFPVVDKATFRENGPAMLASGYAPERLHPHRTSGSTGTPFTALWDDHKALRNRADTIAHAQLAGYRLGGPLYYLRIWQGQYRKGRLRRLLEGMTPVEVRGLDEDRAREVLESIRRRRSPVSLIGYTSALEALCRAAARDGTSVTGHVDAVIPVGEAPTELLRAAAPAAFGRPILARYSNTENGILAQERPGRPGYRINVASYAVEILQLDADLPAAPGEEGRIVVTDLYNRAMPFIRYDTGDVGSFAVDEHGEVDDTVLATVAGRTLDSLFDTSGRSVNPMAIPELADHDLRQYQLVQTGPGAYTLRLNADRDTGRDRRIRGEFLKVLGRDADLTVQYVEEVPLLASGKRQIVLNQWRPAP